MRILLIFALVWLVKKAVEKLRGWLRHRKLVRQLKELGAYGGTVKIKRRSPRPQAGAQLSVEPDGPLPFGYKTAWLAVRCEEPEWVIAALRPRTRQPANWTTGLAAAYGDRADVFVSPALDGFVLVVGLESPKLPDGFPWNFFEVQFFGSHRVADYFHWRRWLNGLCVREFCWDGGEVETETGDPTPEELALGFDQFPHPGGNWSDDQRFPDEESLLDIAAAWGVDPRFEKTAYPPSTGWLCTLEEEDL